MSKSLNFGGNLVTFTAGAVNAENTILHGMRTIPSGFIVVGQNAAGRLYRPQLPGGLGLSSNVVGMWEFEDNANLGVDSGPNALNLTNNNTTQIAGKVANAIHCTAASSQYLYLASSASVQTGDIDFTLASWVYLDSNATFQFVMSKDTNTGGAREYALYYDPTANRFRGFVMRAVDTAVIATADNFGIPSLNTWYFVVVWHDATADTVNIQVNNGVLNSTATGGALQAAGGSEFRIGARKTPASFLLLDGRADQAMFWKQVLTSTERTALYNAGLGVTASIALAPLSGAVNKPWTATQAFIVSSVAGVTYTILFFA
jgi:hypothetical protein